MIEPGEKETRMLGRDKILRMNRRLDEAYIASFGTSLVELSGEIIGINIAT